MSFKTVIFDLDGTLLDTLTDLANAVNYALKVCGYPPHTTEEIRSYVGNGIKNLIKRAMPSDKCENEHEFDVCFREFCGYYDKNMYVCTKPYDGIINLLEKEIKDTTMVVDCYKSDILSKLGEILKLEENEEFSKKVEEIFSLND